MENMFGLRLLLGYKGPCYKGPCKVVLTYVLPLKSQSLVTYPYIIIQKCVIIVIGDYTILQNTSNYYHTP